MPMRDDFEILTALRSAGWPIRAAERADREMADARVHHLQLAVEEASGRLAAQLAAVHGVVDAGADLRPVAEPMVAGLQVVHTAIEHVRAVVELGPDLSGLMDRLDGLMAAVDAGPDFAPLAGPMSAAFDAVLAATQREADLGPVTDRLDGVEHLLDVIGAAVRDSTSAADRADADVTDAAPLEA